MGLYIKLRIPGPRHLKFENMDMGRVAQIYAPGNLDGKNIECYKEEDFPSCSLIGIIHEINNQSTRTG